MGVPLLVALPGPAAAGPVICTLLADLFVTRSLCIGLAQLPGAQGAPGDATTGPQHARQAALRALRALRGALSNPLPWAIALGALLSAAGWRLAGPLDVVVRVLADSASTVLAFGSFSALAWWFGARPVA